MPQRGLNYTIACVAILAVCMSAVNSQVGHASSIANKYRLAFGSCFGLKIIYQTSRIFDSVYADKPDSFIWLGDFAYLDGVRYSRLGVEHHYNSLQIAKQRLDESYNDPHYAKLRKSTKIYGIWDDHDSGINNSDKSNKVKEIVRGLFLDAMDEPKDSLRRTRKGGMYESYYLDADKKIKLILLDVRYQRDVLKDKSVLFKDKSLLGVEQEEFLKKEVLKSEAHFTLIGLGNQLIHDDRLFVERIFPKTRELLLTLYNPKTRVILLSGDVHFAEILSEPCCTHVHGHPIYEFTSSGLSHSVRSIFGSLADSALNFIFPDTYSTPADRFVDLNYAVMDFSIDPKNMNKSSVIFSVRDVDGHTRLSKTLTIGTDLPSTDKPDYRRFRQCVKARGKRMWRIVKNMVVRGLDPRTPVVYVLTIAILIVVMLVYCGIWITFKMWRAIFGWMIRKVFGTGKSSDADKNK